VGGEHLCDEAVDDLVVYRIDCHSTLRGAPSIWMRSGHSICAAVRAP
jgi:hypothetical protein